MSSNSTHKKAAAIQFVLPPVGAAPAVSAATPPPPAPQAASLQPAVSAPALPARREPFTGVGLVTSRIGQAHETQRTIAGLQEKISTLEGERGAQRMDPTKIAPSRWANRHEASFSEPEFKALKDEINQAGGNVQPIMVRPREGAKDGEPVYEIAFGHRRHRACLELGLPVLAVVQPLSDKELFTTMERENRNRRGLSAYEQGVMYQRAIDQGLFSSIRKLAEDISRSHGDVVKAMQIAQLPQVVIEAFASPNEIQFAWAATLKRAWEHDQAAVAAAAEQLAAQRPAAAVEVFRALAACLTQKRDAPQGIPSERKLNLGRGRHAVVSRDADGHTVLKLGPGVLPVEKWTELEKALRLILE